jgi:anti-sigma regulatory factor (Ser/Thr protein kinase)
MATGPVSRIVAGTLAAAALLLGPPQSHEFRLDTAAPTALLPALILQPLMENAVVHGLQDESSRVHVLLEARVTDGRLNVRIRCGWI